MVVLKSQNHEARIQRHYHVLNIQKNPNLNQATQKNTRQILLRKKIPQSKISNPKKSFNHPCHLKSRALPRWGKHDGVQNLLFSIKVVFLSLNLFLFIPYTNYIYKHELNSVDFAKKKNINNNLFLTMYVSDFNKKNTSTPTCFSMQS